VPRAVLPDARRSLRRRSFPIDEPAKAPASPAGREDQRGTPADMPLTRVWHEIGERIDRDRAGPDRLIESCMPTPYSSNGTVRIEPPPPPIRPSVKPTITPLQTAAAVWNGSTCAAQPPGVGELLRKVCELSFCHC
jgi:hypothetical protein